MSAIEPPSSSPARSADAVRPITKADWANAARRSLTKAMRQVRITQGQRKTIVAQVHKRSRFTAWVRDAGGGAVELLVDRDTDYYPPIGAHVEVRLIDGDVSA